MQRIETIILVIVGIINFLPILGAIGVKQLNKLYALDLSNEGIILLMRHRSILFGIIGAFIIYSAFIPSLINLAYIAGLVSMLTFIMLALPIKNHTSQIQRVFYIDIFASILLIIAWVFF